MVGLCKTQFSETELYAETRKIGIFVCVELSGLQMTFWFILVQQSSLEDRVLTKVVSCEITQRLFHAFGRGREKSCVIEQEPFWNVRTHFYHNACTHTRFFDRREFTFTRI